MQKYYDIPGPANPTAKQLRLVAAEIMAYFKALNYDVSLLIFLSLFFAWISTDAIVVGY